MNTCPYPYHPSRSRNRAQSDVRFAHPLPPGPSTNFRRMVWGQKTPQHHHPSQRRLMPRPVYQQRINKESTNSAPLHTKSSAFLLAHNPKVENHLFLLPTESCCFLKQKLNHPSFCLQPSGMVLLAIFAISHFHPSPTALKTCP